MWEIPLGRSGDSGKHRPFGIFLFVIASPGSRHSGLPFIVSPVSDISIFWGLVFCALACPMWPTRTNQEPAYFWMILGANHMQCSTIKCMWMLTLLKKSAAWLLFVWTMFFSAMIVVSPKSSGVSGWRCVAAWKAGRPVCSEGRQAYWADRLHSFLGFFENIFIYSGLQTAFGPQSWSPSQFITDMYWSTT